MKWFKSDTGSIPAVVPPPVAYHVKMSESRENLHWFVKSHSNEISAKVYSEIRELEKTLKEINVFLEDHNPTASDEHMLDSIMQSYLPDAIELFVKLPSHAKAVGDEGDELLLKQCRTMANDLLNRHADLHDRATKDLRTQAAFIDDRFNEANMT